MKIPKSHPRYTSLMLRERIENGIKNRITSLSGLAAHGRGEAFDYLIGEKTIKSAEKSIEAAAALLLLAKYPVISVNGNSAALAAKELSELSKIIPAKLEVNIFHPSKKREVNIKKFLIENDADEVLMPQKNFKVDFLSSNRKYVNEGGIYKADVVLVPLEDGDRTEALVKNGKKVVVVDLNPLSRSAQKATICIVNNITRALPLLIKKIKLYKKLNKKNLKKRIDKYNSKKSLKDALKEIDKNLNK